MEAELQKRRLRVRDAYDRLIMAQPEAARCFVLQKECNAALKADVETINCLIEQHRTVVEQFLEARLDAFGTAKEQSLPYEAILENRLVEYLQLLRVQLLRQSPYRILQELLRPYGIPLYEEVVQAVEEAGKKTELSPYRITYTKLYCKFPALPPHVLCMVIAAARLCQLDEGYFMQKEKKNEAGRVLCALAGEVRRCFKKAQIPFCDGVGGKDNPIVVPDEASAEELLGKLKLLNGKTMRWRGTERGVDMLVYQVNGCHYNSMKKKLICDEKYWLYFKIVQEAEAQELRFYPPGFWRRDERKDGNNESDGNCAKNG